MIIEYVDTTLSQEKTNPNLYQGHTVKARGHMES